MPSTPKPSAIVLSATTASAGVSTSAGEPLWVVVAFTAVPLAAGIALAAADQIRAAQRDRRRAARRDADDAQRRSLERQVARVARDIPDPDQHVEVLLRLIEVHLAVEERDHPE